MNNITLSKLESHELYSGILDARSDAQELTQSLLEYWVWDLYRRKPAPAFRSLSGEVKQSTDLDLLTFFIALAKRNAVVNIPNYTRTGNRTVKEGEHIVSESNRHGPIMALTANKETFRFSVKIKDANVISSDGVGAFRNFNLTMDDGSMYPGWDMLEFIPSAPENAFLSDRRIWDGQKVVLSTVIHRSRWASLFSGAYILSHMLLNRIDAEAKHAFAEKKRLEELGFSLPKAGFVKKVKEKRYPVQVPKFISVVDMPALNGEFNPYEDSQEGLEAANKRRNLLIYTLAPLLRFPVRAVDLAYSNETTRRGKSAGVDFINFTPNWIDVDWEEGFKPTPRARIMWDKLQVTDNVSLRIQRGKKSVQMTAASLDAILLNTDSTLYSVVKVISR